MFHHDMTTAGSQGDFAVRVGDILTGVSHYFDSQPTAPGRRRTITVRLRGRERQVYTDAGVFSAGRLDLGTEVLLRTVPHPPGHGTLVDLGCGWGPIALVLAKEAPQARVLAVDVNERALELTAANAELLGLGNVQTSTPQQLLAAEPGLVVDALWSNPPVRIGKTALHELLDAWLPRLGPAGQAHLVVQRNLGADSLHRWIATELGLPTQRVASAKGFRVLNVRSG